MNAFHPIGPTGASASPWAFGRWSCLPLTSSIASTSNTTGARTNLAGNINGMRVVTAYNRQEDNLAYFNSLQDLNTVNNVRVGSINGVYQPLLNVAGYIGKVIILGTGCYLVLSSGRDGTF